jgi:hypothetical protein
MRRHLFSLGLCFSLGLASQAAHADPPGRGQPARDADRAVELASLASQRLLRLLDETRLSGHPLRTRCVDAKLTQVNSFTRLIIERRERLSAAREQGNETEVAHHRQVIRTLFTQLRRLEREGRSCVHPEPAVASRSTVVTVIVDRGVPREEPWLLTDADRRRHGR